jgi:thiol:disulfide interchange protein
MPRANAGSTRSLSVALVAATIALLAARVAFGTYEAKHPPRWPDLVQWRATADVSEKEGKPVLYEFYENACPACDALQQDVLGDAHSATMISTEFQPTRVIESDESAAAKALRDRFSIDAYPTIVIVGGGLKEPLYARGFGGKEAFEKTLQSALRKSFEVRFEKQ